MQREYDSGIIHSAVADGKMTFILGTEKILEQIWHNKPQVPFSEETLQFLAGVSEAVRRKKDLGQMPEVTAFAFWCRRAHLEQMKTEYGDGKARRLGRGVSLHFAPSNIPVLFAFTMAAGLLAGNSVIVRLPGKRTRQEDAIVCVLREIIKKDFPDFERRIVFCRYDHDRAVTDFLSGLCDVRVIWGSDASVMEIRQSPLPPRAAELPFASRESAAVFDAAAVSRAEDIGLLVRGFYNDTYLNDQNACSSPRMIYWLGTARQVEMAQERFWTALADLLEEKKYQIPPSVAVQKLDGAMMLAAVFDGVRILRDQSVRCRGMCGIADRVRREHLSLSGRETNRLVRVLVPELRKEMWEYTVPGGFFIESGGESLEGIKDILTAYCQTLCVYGLDPELMAEKVERWQVSGADRIVPAGHTLDFELTWDGTDLIEAMSRRIMK